MRNTEVKEGQYYHCRKKKIIYRGNQANYYHYHDCESSYASGNGANIGG